MKLILPEGKRYPRCDWCRSVTREKKLSMEMYSAQRLTNRFTDPRMFQFCDVCCLNNFVQQVQQAGWGNAIKPTAVLFGGV